MKPLRFALPGVALFLSLLLLPSCGLPPATKAAASAARYEAEEFFATTLMFGGSFSPDETELLVTSNQSGVYNAHVVSLAGATNTQVTESKTDAIYTIGFFPTDKRFLYQSDQGGNELTHIYVRETSGRVVDLTPGDKLKARFMGWAFDNSGFWIGTNERDPQFFDVYWHKMDAEGGAYPRSLVFENDGFSVSAVDSKGRWIALTKNRTNNDNNIYLYDQTAKTEPRLVTPHEGPISHSVASFDPRTGDLIYTSDFASEYSRAWSLNVGTGERSLLYEAPWDVTSVRFSRDGRFRTISVNADARTTTVIADRGDGSNPRVGARSVELPVRDPASVAGLRFSPSGRKAAYYESSDTSTGDLRVFDLQTKIKRELASGLSPKINRSDLVEGERVRFPSYDGLMIPGILYRPHQATAGKPVPAIVWVHGGPGGQSRHGYFETLQFLVHRGYAFLSVNNRGSSGYGKSFFHLDDRQHGEGDLKDCIYGRKYLEGLDWVDGDRVGIMGGSYGGYMVAAALAFEPDAFEVGIDIFGVTNWVRTLESIPPWWASFRDSLYAEMGDPATDGERLRRISPLFHASQIRKPLMVVQGANDPRVLQVESDELVEAVRKNNVPVEYIVFPDEGHGFRVQENRVKAAKAYLAFLDEHLRALPPTTR